MYLAQVRTDQGTGVYLATETYLFCFKVTGDVADTEGMAKENAGGASNCKERGVEGIPLSNFLVGMRVRRIHRGPARGFGLKAFIQEVRYWDGTTFNRQLDMEKFALQFGGDTAARDEFLQKFNTSIASRSNRRQEGDEHRGARRSAEILQIDRWDIRNAPPAELKKRELLWGANF